METQTYSYRNENRKPSHAEVLDHDIKNSADIKARFAKEYIINGDMKVTAIIESGETHLRCRKIVGGGFERGFLEYPTEGSFEIFDADIKTIQVFERV